MPPHNDLTDPLYRAYTAAAPEITVTTTAADTNINHYTFTTPAYTVNTINYPDLNVGNAWTGTYMQQAFVTLEDLEKALRKFYQIMTDHVVLDISEDEFVKLLNETEEE